MAKANDSPSAWTVDRAGGQRDRGREIWAKAFGCFLVIFGCFPVIFLGFSGDFLGFSGDFSRVFWCSLVYFQDFLGFSDGFLRVVWFLKALTGSSVGFSWGEMTIFGGFKGSYLDDSRE